jgi:hypothetical protein
MPNQTNPGTRAVAITPSDSADIAVTRGVYVGGSGTLKVDMADGTTVTFTALAAGVIHPIQVKRVYSTGTAATNILGIY